MLNESGIDQVYLARGSTDLRKSIDGLAVLVLVLGQGFSHSVDPLPKGSDPTKIRQIIHKYQESLEASTIRHSKDSSM